MDFSGGSAIKDSPANTGDMGLIPSPGGPGGFPGGSVVKNPLANTGDAALIPRPRRSPGERNGNPHQFSYFGNPMDRGDQWPMVHGVTESRTQLSD